MRTRGGSDDTLIVCKISEFLSRSVIRKRYAIGDHCNPLELARMSGKIVGRA